METHSSFSQPLEHRPFDDKLELLAYLLAEEEAITNTSTLSPLTRRPDSSPLLASFAQRRFWFLEQLHAEPALYTIPTAYTIQGNLAVALLERCLNQIIQRHDILRTTFTLSDDDCIPVLHSPCDHALPLIDLCAVPQEKRMETALDLITTAARLPFNLTIGPLLRTLLVRLDRQTHIFLLTMHHSIADGESVALILKEMITFYKTDCTSLPPPPTLQYADFAWWQRQMPQHADLASRLSTWKDYLTTDIPLLDLPTDYPQPPEATFRGALLSLDLQPNLVQQLHLLCKQEGVTLFMVLLAVFQLLLYRYTEQHTIIVGSPISGRTHQELENLPGCFINTIALRTNLAGNPSFLELLARVQASTLEAYSYQDIPFEQLVSSLPTDKASLFEVMFSYETMRKESIELDNLLLRPLVVDTGTAKFAITLFVLDKGDDLTVTIEYKTDLFAPNTISHMLKHFERVLSTLTSFPKQLIRNFSLVSPQELITLSQGQSGSTCSDTHSSSIAQTFEAQVKRSPHALALIDGSNTLTYQQLNTRANQLAHLLRQHGIGPEIPVALFLDRSLDLVIAMLAILKAGGVYVPLDTASPRERLSFILQDCRTSLVLSQHSLIDCLPHGLVDVLSLDEIQPIALPTTDLPSQTDGRQLAYCIYTSGSTGTPKGVQVAHAHLLSLLTAAQPIFAFGPADAWTLFHSPAFDFSVWEIWGALLSGGRLVIVPYWISRSPQEFWQLVRQQRITVLNQTPSAFRQLVSHITVASSLRVIIFGGEALNIADLQPWFERWGNHGPTLLNMYGITETTVHVTQRIVHQQDLQYSSISPIGQPLHHQEIYLLDPYMQSVPTGITGEIYVGGTGLARGYLHQPDLTAERFVPHPFVGAGLAPALPGARLYKSGDLARQLPSGELVYLGRVDHQLKIRGFRIESGEIEHRLRQHPSILAAAVWVTETTNAEHRLTAYLVVSPDSEAEMTAQQIRSYLLEYLPEYMLPTAYVLLEHLPLTTNHKIDYNALPQPKNHIPISNQAFAAPQTPDEQLLAAIWQQVLNSEKVGRHDNFFALGGDSIRSIQILAQAKQHNLHFSLQQLFQHPTIAALSPILQHTPATAIDAVLPATPPFGLLCNADRTQLPSGVVDAYPLTMLQTGMLYHMQLQPEIPTYHNIFSMHIRASLTIECLQAALQCVISHHPMLRTSFDMTTYSEPLQLVHQEVMPLLTYEELSHHTNDEQEKIIAQYIAEEKRRPFDLRTPPLLRFHIHRRSETTFQFTLTENHAILDGWSLMATLAELFDHHNAAIHNQKLPLANTFTSSFRDFVAHERTVLQSEEQRRYWQQKLSGYTFNRLAHTLAPIIAPDQHIYSFEYQLPQEEYEALQRLAIRTSVPLKSVLLTVHLKVMSIMSGQRDVLTGLTTTSRPEEDGGEQMRGLFLNTVPFRQQLQVCSWSQLVKTTFMTETELLPFSHYPLAAIQRDNGGETLFETLFTYLHFHSIAYLTKKQNFEVIQTIRSEVTNFAINACFSLDPLHNQLSLLLDLDASRFSETHIETLTYCYRQIIHVVAHEPDSTHTAQSFLPPSELQDMLIHWNAPSTSSNDVGSLPCLHHLFEGQVGRTPDAVALIGSEQTVTYQHLNAQANQLGHFLHHLKVGPDVPVAVCLEPSPALLICLLAILKAGGCYLPLDPHTPPQRLKDMLEDAHASLLLTQYSLLSSLPVGQTRIICQEDVQPSLARFPADIPPSSEVLPDNLAYIMFTSGSTGRPKGSMLPHRGLTNYVIWAAEAYNVASGSGSPLHTSISFDLTVTSLFPSLIVGKPVILLTEHEELISLFRQQSCSPVKLTPAHLTLLEQLIEQDTSSKELHAQTFVIGGEALTANAISRWQRYSPNSAFINEYGPTETSVGCCIYQVSHTTNSPDTIPIGQPAAHAQLYVLDSFMQPVPRGVAGELYIGGPGLARGYLSAPDLTAERFLPNPFSSQHGSRLYRTGDLVRLLPTGNLEFLARLDQQVKIRGFRIELGEIAAALVRHPAVQESVVLCKEESAAKKLLIAYCTLKNGYVFDESALHLFLRHTLPAYMLPNIYILLEKLPLTTHGKIDHAALPFPTEDIQRKTPFVPPQTPLEHLLSDIWAEVLHRTEVGMEDDFFALGGDSLSAMQVVSRLRAELQVEMSLRTFLEHPTILELLTLLDQDEEQRNRLHKIAQLFQTVAELSDDEIQNMLTKRNRE